MISSSVFARARPSRHHAIAALACVAAATLPVAAEAQVYNLSADWSDSANPNGAWEYGPGLTHYAIPNDSNAFNPAAANGYWGVAPNFSTSPFMVKTTSNGSGASGYNDNDFLTGDVVVHSNNNGSPVTITWTAPSAGSIALASSVWYAHSVVTRSDDITALLGATSLGSVTVANGITRANQLTLANGSYTVAQGEVLSFSFSKTAGQEFGSIAGISATIDFTADVSAAPEPASWAMMIVGFGVAGIAMRRRPNTRLSYGA